MLKDTIDKVKFKVLVRRLARFGETERSVIGLLELLWRHTAINAPRGDIGRFSDEEIAAIIQFDHNPKELVDALVESGWIDRCQENRLVVHDWSEHAPRWVHAKLSREGREVIKPNSVSTVVGTTVSTAVATEDEQLQTVEQTVVDNAEPTLFHSYPSHSSHSVSKSAGEPLGQPATQTDPPSKEEGPKKEPKTTKNGRSPSKPKEHSFTADDVTIDESLLPKKHLIQEWLDYKASRRECYQDDRYLTRTVARYVGHPEWLEDDIVEAMANQNKGFYFDDRFSKRALCAPRMAPSSNRDGKPRSSNLIESFKRRYEAGEFR